MLERDLLPGTYYQWEILPNYKFIALANGTRLQIDGPDDAFGSPGKWLPGDKRDSSKVQIIRPSQNNINKKDFIQTYVATFLASHAVENYRDCCGTGDFKPIQENAPVEDALFLASKVWDRVNEES